MINGYRIAPGRTRSILTIPQVRMILRIYYTDQYRCRLKGQRTTRGLRVRLAQQFGVSVNVIKKIITLKHNQPQRGTYRNRFRSIDLRSLKRDVRKREERRLRLLDADDKMPGDGDCGKNQHRHQRRHPRRPAEQAQGQFADRT